MLLVPTLHGSLGDGFDEQSRPILHANLDAKRVTTGPVNLDLELATLHHELARQPECARCLSLSVDFDERLEMKLLVRHAIDNYRHVVPTIYQLHIRRPLASSHATSPHDGGCRPTSLLGAALQLLQGLGGVEGAALDALPADPHRKLPAISWRQGRCHPRPQRHNCRPNSQSSRCKNRRVCTAAERAGGAGGNAESWRGHHRASTRRGR
mmetsp:Transcript_59398/g.150752  ORF Transcript_59398/g.150752 Transcript_59398/m.150752 type:complete len:210 (+) Transcript_59398:142-771(+)